MNIRIIPKSLRIVKNSLLYLSVQFYGHKNHSASELPTFQKPFSGRTSLSALMETLSFSNFSLSTYTNWDRFQAGQSLQKVKTSYPFTAVRRKRELFIQYQNFHREIVFRAPLKQPCQIKKIRIADLMCNIKQMGKLACRFCQNIGLMFRLRKSAMVSQPACL